jgi:hypothetical protein
VASVTVDDRATQADLDRLAGLIRGAAIGASIKSAEDVQERTRVLLLSRAHPPFTKTPSLPGTPPAAITGELAASVLVTNDGESAFVGPTTDYGREQELGGPMKGHPMMHWQEPPGVWHHSRAHSLPDRPYLKPALDSALADGTIERIFTDAAEKALEEV